MGSLFERFVDLFRRLARRPANRRKARSPVLRVEGLEDRRVLDVMSWVGPGDFNNAANWWDANTPGNVGHMPTVKDDLTIGDAHTKGFCGVSSPSFCGSLSVVSTANGNTFSISGGGQAGGSLRIEGDGMPSTVKAGASIDLTASAILPNPPFGIGVLIVDGATLTCNGSIQQIIGTQFGTGRTYVCGGGKVVMAWDGNSAHNDANFGCDMVLGLDPLDSENDAGELDIGLGRSGVQASLSGSHVLVYPTGLLTFDAVSTAMTGPWCNLYSSPGLATQPVVEVKGGLIYDAPQPNSQPNPATCELPIDISSGGVRVFVGGNFEATSTTETTMEDGTIDLGTGSTTKFDVGLKITGGTLLFNGTGSTNTKVNLIVDTTNGLAINNANFNVGKGTTDYPEADVTGLVTISNGVAYNTNVNHPVIPGPAPAGGALQYGKLVVSGTCVLGGGAINVTGNGQPASGDVYQFLSMSNGSLSGDFGTWNFLGALANVNAKHQEQTGNLGWDEVYI